MSGRKSNTTNVRKKVMQEREKLKSRLGFILISAGCAIGIGNVWKFPYMAGKGGGGSFVLFYIFFLLILGLPIMTMEFAVGRASQKSPVKAYQALEKPGQKWHIHGYITLIGCYLLMMFYTTVAGWMLHYFYLTATGKFVGMNTEEVTGVFSEMLGQPLVMGFWMVVVVAMGILVCSLGLQNGLERITKVMMTALLLIMIVLALNSFAMDGAKEGLSFYLIPDWGRMKEVGVISTIVGAMNQAFFTLSLGIGAMAIFGSYIGKERTLLGESINIALLDTFVAITSGLIIFPACFTFGVDQTSGPSLIFMTLPNIFNHISMGRLWGSLFFMFLAFAAFSTVFAVFENIISCGMELTGWSRKKSSYVNLVLIILLSLPCVLGYNVWAWDGFAVFGGAILDLEDFLVSNILLPIGSLVYLLFCVTRYGWGWKNFKKEANEGKGAKVQDWMRVYLTYILPVIVLFIFGFGIYDKFFAT
ncbi:MAG: sodium-dependent transporter [Eubacterium sp.]|nr:sodium-dependent transporter [Eubacterium sp.]